MLHPRLTRYLGLFFSAAGILVSFVFFILFAALNSAGDGPPNRSPFTQYFAVGVLVAIASFAGMMATFISDKISTTSRDVTIGLVVITASCSLIFLGDLRTFTASVYLALSTPWIAHYFYGRCSIPWAVSVTLSIILALSPVGYGLAERSKRLHANEGLRKARESHALTEQKHSLAYHSRYAFQYKQLIAALRSYYRDRQLLPMEDLPVYTPSKSKYVNTPFGFKNFSKYCENLNACRSLRLRWEPSHNSPKLGVFRDDEASLEASIETTHGASLTEESYYKLNHSTVILKITPHAKKSAYVQFRLDEDSQVMCGNNENRPYTETPVLPCLVE